MDADRRPIRVMVVGASLIEERTIKAAVEAFEQMNRILVEEKVAFRLRDFAEHLNVIEVRTCSTDCVIDPARRYTVVKTIPTQKMRPPTHTRIIRKQHK